MPSIDADGLDDFSQNNHYKFVINQKDQCICISHSYSDFLPDTKYKCFSEVPRHRSLGLLASLWAVVARLALFHTRCRLIQDHFSPMLRQQTPVLLPQSRQIHYVIDTVLLQYLRHWPLVKDSQLGPVVLVEETLAFILDILPRYRLSPGEPGVLRDAPCQTMK